MKTKIRRAIVFFTCLFSGAVTAQTCPPNNPPKVAPDSRFIVSEPRVGEFVVTDTRTGLVWKKCTEGTSGQDCTGTASALTWTQALTAANNSTHANHTAWRLPSIMELRSLIETSCFNPSINRNIFNRVGSGAYWTSTTIGGSPSTAWTVHFSNGRTEGSLKSAALPALLVRGGITNNPPSPLDTFSSEADFVPNLFSLMSQVNVPRNSLRTSETITVGGLTTAVGVGVTGTAGSEYSVNGGPFTAAPGSIANGNTVAVRHTSSNFGQTTVTTTLRIGTISRDFTSTTVPNVAPNFSPSPPITRQQGSLVNTAVQVGTVSDDESAAGTLIVSQVVGGSASGVTANNLTNTSGTVAAIVNASCSATSGTLRFQVSDGVSSTTGETQINVTNNTPPSLLYPSSVSIDSGSSTTVNPSSGPSDNGAVASIEIQSLGTYSGNITVNSSTGQLSLSNPSPVGTHNLTIRIVDNCGAQSLAPLSLVVNNVPPTINAIANQSTSEDTAATVNFTVGDIETPTSALMVTASSGNLALLPESGITLGGIGAARTITIAPELNLSGSGAITLTVTDGNSTSSSRTFTLTVLPVNDPPSFIAGPNQIINPGTIETQTISNWATEINDGDPDFNQSLTFTVINNNSSLFSIQPAISSNGTLTFTPSGAIGTAILNISLTDDASAGGPEITTPIQNRSIIVPGQNIFRNGFEQ